MNANVLQWDGGPATTRSTTSRSPIPQRDRAVDPLHDALAADGRRGVLAVVHGHGPRRVALRAQGDVPDRGARGRARSVPAHAGRRRPLRPRDGRAASRTSRGSSRGSRRCRRPSTSTRCCGAPASPRRSSCSPIPTSRSRARCGSPGASSSSTAPAAARRTCGAPSTPSRWAWAHANDLRTRGGRAAAGRLPRRRQRLRAAPGPPAGTEHAGRGALRRRRLPLDQPAARDPQRQPLRADDLALRGARRQAQGGRRGRRAARARWWASPTTTPTGTWPTATTARWPRCA